MASPSEPTSTSNAASNAASSSSAASPAAAGSSSSSSSPPATKTTTHPSVSSSYSGGRRFGSIIRLRPECVAAYKECHANCWPEVQKQITDCHIHDYVIYHDPETGLLFSSFKYSGSDFERDMALMRENPRSLVPGAQSSEAGAPSWWKPIEEVFYQA
ncbi:hypothetical protein C6P46_000596 [Rhodotorula mucilaginosa]|uniref:Uncharacterized protein n=1 Tax=Rhodotorula mucilaginosa TaxID=5537 RepID=A0A9P6W564_RHOMI|nr:hypothetical protein C6P46_000596 [Rhodotorula mucilaginosa]